MSKNTICLWFNHNAEEAARFYTGLFPDSHLGAIHRSPTDYPDGKAGDVLTVEFVVAGIPCLGLNGGRRGRLRAEVDPQLARREAQHALEVGLLAQPELGGGGFDLRRRVRQRLLHELLRPAVERLGEQREARHHPDALGSGRRLQPQPLGEPSRELLVLDLAVDLEQPR